MKLYGGQNALGLAALSASGVTLLSVRMYEVIDILTQFRCGATLRKMSKEQKATAKNWAPHETSVIMTERQTTIKRVRTWYIIQQRDFGVSIIFRTRKTSTHEQQCDKNTPMYCMNLIPSCLILYYWSNLNTKRKKECNAALASSLHNAHLTIKSVDTEKKFLFTRKN